MAASSTDELDDYMEVATECEFDRDDIAQYTKDVLAWWRALDATATGLDAWKAAARIVFGMSPNSCGCERVFALLKNMYGDNQERTLADAVSAGMRLAYNKRNVG